MARTGKTRKMALPAPRGVCVWSIAISCDGIRRLGEVRFTFAFPCGYSLYSQQRRFLQGPVRSRERAVSRTVSMEGFYASPVSLLSNKVGTRVFVLFRLFL